jgi:hypothetical protein
MENKTNWMTILLVAVVVAIAASLITANITGNVIKVANSSKGTDVYTKIEMDRLLSQKASMQDLNATYSYFTTNQGVLNTLNKCAVVRPTIAPGANASYNCNSVCNKNSTTIKNCIGGFWSVTAEFNGYVPQYKAIACNEAKPVQYYKAYLDCICC